MAELATDALFADAVPAGRSPVSEPAYVRHALIAFTVILLVLFLVLPLIVVFTQALALGPATALSTFADPDATSAICLTLIVAAIAVPCTLVFGIAAAWAIAKFRLPGRTFLVTLIDLPFSVSPVVAGLIYVLLLGPFTPV